MPRIVAPWMIKRELLTKSEGETDPESGHKPEERPYPNLVRFGVINLDKPPGPSSHEVAAWVRRILNVKQAGHGGTLEASEA
jgi:H/ACA ribonucleoprotein complex subunit 4